MWWSLWWRSLSRCYHGWWCWGSICRCNQGRRCRRSLGLFRHHLSPWLDAVCRLCGVQLWCHPRRTWFLYGSLRCLARQGHRLNCILLRSRVPPRRSKPTELLGGRVWRATRYVGCTQLVSFFVSCRPLSEPLLSQLHFQLYLCLAALRWLVRWIVRYWREPWQNVRCQ